jgi:hypothetical protein
MKKCSESDSEIIEGEGKASQEKTVGSGQMA